MITALDEAKTVDSMGARVVDEREMKNGQLVGRLPGARSMVNCRNDRFLRR
jgi:hypothetical protein